MTPRCSLEETSVTVLRQFCETGGHQRVPPTEEFVRRDKFGEAFCAKPR
jgi:hypothetical protein